MSLTLKPYPGACSSISIQVDNLHMVSRLVFIIKVKPVKTFYANLTCEAFFHICNIKNLTPYHRGRRYEGCLKRIKGDRYMVTEGN